MCPWLSLERRFHERGSSRIRICSQEKRDEEGAEIQSASFSIWLKAVICSTGFLALRLLGSISRRLLRLHIKKAKDTNGHNCETDFRDRWRKQISVNIQKCNAKVISKKVSKLSMRRAEDFLYDTDIQHHVH